MMMTIKEQLDSLRGRQLDGDEVADIFSEVLILTNTLSNLSARLQETFITPEEMETVLEIRHARNDLMSILQTAIELGRETAE